MIRQLGRLYYRVYSGLPAEIWMLSLALFVNRLGTMVLPFFALYAVQELHFSELSAGRLLSVYGVGSVCGVYVAGRLIHAVGAIRLQTLFFLLAVPTFLVVPLLREWLPVAGALFWLSFFADGTRPANNTAVAHFAPRGLQVRAFGLQRMALNLGISFGPAIGGLLTTVGFVWLFVVDAATTFLCALVLIWCFGFRRQVPAATSEESCHVETRPPASPLKDRPYLAFLAGNLLTALVFFQFHVTYPLYLSDHYGLSKPTIGLIYGVNTVVIVLTEMLLLDVVRAWPLVRTIGWGAGLSCFGFGMLPWGHTVWFCVVSMLVITLGEMLWMPLATGWVAERSDRGDRGAYMSWYTMTYSVAAMVAPSLGGAIYQADPDGLWHASVGWGCVSLVGYTWLHRWVGSEARANADLPAAVGVSKESAG